PSEVGRMNVVVLPPSESLRLTSFATACASAGAAGRLRAWRCKCQRRLRDLRFRHQCRTANRQSRRAEPPVGARQPSSPPSAPSAPTPTPPARCSSLWSCCLLLVRADWRVVLVPFRVMGCAEPPNLQRLAVVVVMRLCALAAYLAWLPN